MKTLLTLLGCFYLLQAKAQTLTDKKATPETKVLYQRLKDVSAKHILFGHQHATEYGHGWVGTNYQRSDVKDVVGDHPAIIGVDFSGLSGLPDSIVQQNKQHLQENITATYNRGGITTVSWHFPNPASKGGFYWVDSLSVATVPLLLPGAKYHEAYKKILQTIGNLAHTIKGKQGEAIPLLFRPYHEQDGDWFWWGRSHCSAKEFKQLWQFTVQYLRDSLHVHNFIYVFSPDCKFSTMADFTERYPGNKWVDMVGFDDYADFGRDGKYNLDAAFNRLNILTQFAKKNKKLAALTETGLESVAQIDWYTQTLLPTLTRQPFQLVYVLVWRNDSKSATHYYAPFPGHPAVPDFKLFYQHEYTWFLNDLPDMYH